MTATRNKRYTQADSLKRNAELRAAVIAALNAATRPMMNREIFVADPVARLRPHHNDFDRLLNRMAESGLIARDGTRTPYLYVIAAANGSAPQLKKNPNKTRAAQVRETILATLRDAPGPVPPDQLHKALAQFNAPIQSIYSLIYSMNKKGQIRRNEAGAYLLPDAHAVTVSPPHKVNGHVVNGSGSPPTVSITYDRPNQRIRLEVTGPLIVDFGIA